MNSVQILDRILDPVVDTFTPEVARHIVALKADAEVQNRIDELAKKSNEGTLTEDERAEYRCFVDAIDLVSLLQAKSRRVLKASQ